MPRGNKSKYTDKQKRMAEHIEDGYRERGASQEDAESRAWATVNKADQGGKKSGGSGRGKARDTSPMEKGGRKGAAADKSRSAADRSASARKAAATRKQRAGQAGRSG